MDGVWVLEVTGNWWPNFSEGAFTLSFGWLAINNSVDPVTSRSTYWQWGSPCWTPAGPRQRQIINEDLTIYTAKPIGGGAFGTAFLAKHAAVAINSRKPTRHIRALSGLKVVKNSKCIRTPLGVKGYSLKPIGTYLLKPHDVYSLPACVVSPSNRAVGE